jgi:hypothetical protein
MGRPRAEPGKIGLRAKRRTSAKTLAPSRTILRIQGALSLDLLTAAYRDLLPANALKHACTGHCYVASEAAFHLFAKRKGFVPFVFKHGDGTTHWWLENRESGERIDPSRPQLGSRPFPYSRGRRAVFLTTRPSERARELMRRVRRVGK